MVLGKLLDKKASLTPTTSITFMADVDVMAWVDEIAGELDLSRSVVLREILREGAKIAYGEWMQALENGAKATAERSARTGGKPGKGQK